MPRIRFVQEPDDVPESIDYVDDIDGADNVDHVAGDFGVETIVRDVDATAFLELVESQVNDYRRLAYQVDEVRLRARPVVADVEDHEFVRTHTRIPNGRLSDLLAAWPTVTSDTPPQDEPEAPAHTPAPATTPDAPWVPQRGDYAVVGAGARHFREGEWVIIEDVNDYYSRNNVGCGVVDCASCERNLSVLGLHPASSDDSRQEWTTTYNYIPARSVTPVAPTSTSSAQTVRCQSGSHVGMHLWTGACVRPVMCTNPWDEPNDTRSIDRLVPAFEVAYAAELIEIRARMQAARERALTMRPGERYVISGNGSSYFGHVAEIIAPVEMDNRILCNIYYPDGEYRRGGYYLRVSSLGTRWYRTMLGQDVPSFIRFGADLPAARVLQVTDREITESLDDHECDDNCFESGCSARIIDPDEDVEYVGEIPIHSYSHRPVPIFSGTGPVFMGTELELSTGWNEEGRLAQYAAAKIITGSEIGHLVYLKSDGSISGYGFEAVTHPMSYDWLVENWPEDLLRRMRNAGATPHSSCGMHVHVNRAGFSSPVHAYKWIKFMYRNKRHMARMARRDPSQWGSFDHDAERQAAKWHAKGGYGAYNRYTAINCTPRATYEVRIFASTLNRTRFLGSLALVDASVEYTRQLSTQEILSNGGWDFAPFREFVSGFSKYQPLQREFARILG